MLITLDVPDHLVQFSDANAWYCALEDWPCYEYEEGIVESQKLAAFEKLGTVKMLDFLKEENTDLLMKDEG